MVEIPVHGLPFMAATSPEFPTNPTYKKWLEHLGIHRNAPTDPTLLVSLLTQATDPTGLPTWSPY